MKPIAIALLALGACLAGCNAHDKAEANSQAQKAKTGIQAAAQNAQTDLSNDAMSLRVKTALLTSNRVDASHVSVKTNAKTVYLRGSVPSEGEKELAARIARDTVPEGFNVAVQLQVAANAKGTKR